MLVRYDSFFFFPLKKKKKKKKKTLVSSGKENIQNNHETFTPHVYQYKSRQL